MFEVYLNERRNLLVIGKGTPLPLIAATGRWRKTKKKVARVSDEIRSAVQIQGYYIRKLNAKDHGPPKRRRHIVSAMCHFYSIIPSLTAILTLFRALNRHVSTLAVISGSVV